MSTLLWVRAADRRSTPLSGSGRAASIADGQVVVPLVVVVAIPAARDGEDGEDGEGEKEEGDKARTGELERPNGSASDPLALLLSLA